ncbi:MAG: hypothetical protein ACFB3T_13655 [Geminicoccaceae bacterium]
MPDTKQTGGSAGEACGDVMRSYANLGKAMTRSRIRCLLALVLLAAPTGCISGGSSFGISLGTGGSGLYYSYGGRDPYWDRNRRADPYERAAYGPSRGVSVAIGLEN